MADFINKEMKNVVISIDAVSYTHLDVYKRQGSLDPALKKNALNFGRNVRPAGTKVGTPVSYTHLIVLPERIYKTDCCVVEYAKENHIKIEL